MKFAFSDSSITDSFEVAAAPPIRLSLLLRELRREKTGLHGLVAIAEGGKVLAHDTFNVGRSEDRRRLSKLASGVMSRTALEALTLEGLNHRLDMICLYAMTEWETDRFTIVSVDPGKSPPPRVFLLSPYIEEGTGTIIFAPPGAGKSWLLTLIASDLSSGQTLLWESGIQRAALYVDLERSAQHFQRRTHQLLGALGRPAHPMPYLKARGMGLPNLRRKLREWVESNPGGVVLYDSISRVGMGSLKEDDVANAIVDLANAASETWIALAHSPRADAGHAFGSVHFDAGADTVIRLMSEQRGNDLGCCLRVTKSNHLGRVNQILYRLVFGPAGLTRIEKQKSTDWPELSVVGGKMPLDEAVLMYLGEHHGSTTEEIAEGTGRDRTTIATLMNHDARFGYEDVREGRKTWRSWRVRAQA